MLLSLRNGGQTVIDDELFESVIEYEVWDGLFFQFRICDLSWRHKDNHRVPYVQSVASRGGRACCIRLHRLIAQAPKHSVVDHINRNVLDNRRCNLRVCDHATNNRNRKKQRPVRDGVYKNALTGQVFRRLRCSGKESLVLIGEGLS